MSSSLPNTSSCYGNRGTSADSSTYRGFCILFCWIPSRVGITGNELADHSAKTAASLLHREIPYCDVKKSVARRIFSLWQETWDLQVRNKLHCIKPFYWFVASSAYTRG
ncbi:hypothetical protein AVEN_114261-1 [Araneus ventricosus]|uniref:RNase H type-1 domain-containing protein n=1 Tax=Araneus ventricosus TaxID=182803 RepID=A0A4Y2MHV8_ARAVE|nr:hypothetical protein AVEN_114261-1 [Araneus ventricosus]